MEKTEILTQESFQKNIDLYVDKLVQKKLDKLIITDKLFLSSMFNSQSYLLIFIYYLLGM